MIMGYSGTMESWAPIFDTLAAWRFRVIVFDNAGVGDTSRPASGITITSDGPTRRAR